MKAKLYLRGIKTNNRAAYKVKGRHRNNKIKSKKKETREVLVRKEIK